MEDVTTTATLAAPATSVPPAAGDSAPLLDPTASELVVAAPGAGTGYWAGAPSAVHADGVTYLAYRLRRPVRAGRGYAVVIARSVDGVTFEELTRLERTDDWCASFERPALVRRPDGGWRLYLSCSTAATPHWWIDAIDADDPAGFRAQDRVTVWPGDEHEACKDPVVTVDAAGWHAWICVHPLPHPAEADRMRTKYARSADGLTWTWSGEPMTGRPGEWDARGFRLASVLPGGRTALYDGRRSAAENWFERTGIAVGAGDGLFVPFGDAPVGSSPVSDGGLRYASTVVLGDGAVRVYYEVAEADGTHSIRTQLVDLADAVG